MAFLLMIGSRLINSIYSDDSVACINTNDRRFTLFKISDSFTS